MTTSYLDRGKGRIAYEVTGDGPLLVMLPGMGDLRSVYRFTTPALVEAGFRVAAMDLRGHGESDATFRAYDDEALASDALALVEALSAGPALIVGNSMGAGAAVVAAADRPTAVAGLALLGPWVRNGGANPLVPLLFRVALARPWGPLVWRSYYRSLYPTRPPADLADHQARQSQALRRHWRAFTASTRTSHAPAERRLPAVHAPTLVLMGTKDRDWPDSSAEGRFVADALHGDLLLVDGAGHYPQAEFPEVVNPALVGFARRVFGRA
jgi:pimeloyl-ACP methyl ester carboxylesterase